MASAASALGVPSDAEFTFIDNIERTTKVLQDSAISDFADLQLAIVKIRTKGSTSDDWKAPQNVPPISGLKLAIEQFTKHVQAKTEHKNFDFYKDELPHIIKWALEYDKYPKLGLLLRYSTATLTVSQTHCRHILANAFFLNTTAVGAKTIGDTSFARLYFDSYSCAVQRLVCQLAYFFQIVQKPQLCSDTATVGYQRAVISQDQVPDWAKHDKVVDTTRVHVHTDSMEHVPHDNFVDFANKQLHIGQIIASLTQEEVMFSCAPECFISLLVVDQLAPNEVVVFRGLRRFSDYTGYLRTFMFAGLHASPERTWDSLAIDSVEFGHFREMAIDRDLNKCVLGFRVCKGQLISTGHWGCGAFGGDKTLKFLQQLMCAEEAGVRLQYSTFKDEPLKKKFEELLKHLHDNNVTVGKLYKCMHEYQGKGGDHFFNFVLRSTR